MAFGARIGEDVLLRPRLRVRFPWKLTIGDRSWIGEGVWLRSQDQATIGSDARGSRELPYVCRHFGSGPRPITRAGAPHHLASCTGPLSVNGPGVMRTGTSWN